LQKQQLKRVAIRIRRVRRKKLTFKDSNFGSQHMRGHQFLAVFLFLWRLQQIRGSTRSKESAGRLQPILVGASQHPNCPISKLEIIQPNVNVLVEMELY
jgi:hypothetical protein